MRSVADEAAWQAWHDYDAARGPSVAQFARGRVLAAALTRFRQEWSYAYHCACRGHDTTTAPAHSESSSSRLVELLHDALAGLCPADRWVIEQTCILGRSESDVGRSLGITHQAVSKRKRRALEALRAALSDQTGTRAPERLQKPAMRANHHTRR